MLTNAIDGKWYSLCARNGRFAYPQATSLIILLVCSLLAPLFAPCLGFYPATKFYPHDHFYYGAVNPNHHNAPTAQHHTGHYHNTRQQLSPCPDVSLPDVLLLPHNMAGVVSVVVVVETAVSQYYWPIDDTNLADYFQERLHAIREIYLPAPKKPPRLFV